MFLLNKNVEKIKNKTGIISAQIWLTISKENNNNLKNNVTQIFDIDEAKPHIYMKYEQNLKSLEILKDFYFELIKFGKEWEKDEDAILNYYENFSI